MVTGSLQALPRIAMFYGFRVVGETHRRTLFALFIEEFRAIVADMSERTLELFEDLGAATPLEAERRVAHGGA